MPQEDNELERGQRPLEEARIMDLRHSRNVESGAEEAEEHAEDQSPAPAAETPAESAATPPTEAAQPAAKAEEPVTQGSAAQTPQPPQDAASNAAEAPPAEHNHYPDEDMPPEMDQLRQIFSIGIGGYLRGQISMLANFALIYLGRAPNPATGLVTRDIEQARIAIDTLEFVTARIAADLTESERLEVASLLSELKYLYMQGVTEQAGEVSSPPGNGQ